MIKKVIISPPFGNYIDVDWATSVRGSFTLKRRKGLIKQIIKTVRPIRGGWVNKIGLRNKGIENVKFDTKSLFSITSVDGKSDWDFMLEKIPTTSMVEVNLGCPNTKHFPIDSYTLATFVKTFQFVSVKLPPTHTTLDLISFCAAAGVKTIHLCNTIPVDRGGESGGRIKEYSLPLIESTKRLFPEIKVIGGGGIYSPQDVKDYRNVGADYYSLSTIWMTPWRVKEVTNECYR